MRESMPSRPDVRPRKCRRLGFSCVAVLAGIGTIALCFGELPGDPAIGRSGPAAKAGKLVAHEPARPTPPLRSLIGGQPWLNGRLDDPALQGKVVLVNFWTYSCINSLRPLPYLRAWADKYRARRLVVVGVHTPEFAFERDSANVRRAIAALNVRYPVVLDGDSGIWRAFRNQGWPGFYLIDANGRVRYQRVGEGDFGDTERWIQRLLAERDGGAFADLAAPVNGTGVEAAADWGNQRSPETYIGYAKARGFASPGGLATGDAHLYTPAARLPVNHWDLSGAWAAGGEFAVSAAPGGRLRYRFHARDLHLVLGAAPGSPPIRFRVMIDGRAPGADHGVDIDPNGWGVLRDDRLYQLVRQAGAVSDRTFEIEFRSADARAYAFTFG